MISKIVISFIAISVSFNIYALDLSALGTDQITKSQLKETLSLLKSINKISDSDYQSAIKKIDGMSEEEFKKFLKDAGTFASDPKNVEQVKKKLSL